MSKLRQQSGMCPICGAASDLAYRPFCSRRCADVDLARWLRGAYLIPEPAGEERDEDARGTDQGVRDRNGDGH
jgi:uncharacterized protein